MIIEHPPGLENRTKRYRQRIVQYGVWLVFFLHALGVSAGFGWAPEVHARVLIGDESNYQNLVRQLQPGDLLSLKPGIYTKNLHIRNLSGRPDAPIIITGSVGAAPSVFVAQAHTNTVNIVDSSYITVRNLVLEGRGLNADAVKSGPRANWSHDIAIENLVIRGYGGDQQIVGISTKCPVWNWIVRNNIIIGAGTGMYFGDADGSAPFVGGLIEHNLVIDTLGYNLEIKHQTGRQGVPNMPTEPTQTVIRYNTFVKAHNGSTAPLARPNVLLGHLPLTGPGKDDRYLVYGNFFYQNPTERLFQAEGNVAIYNNLFVNDSGDAIAIQPHNDVPRRIWMFHNTVLARGAGIRFTATPETEIQDIAANAVFAVQPIWGGDQRGNLVGTLSDAPRFLRHAGLKLPLDLHPTAAASNGAASVEAHNFRDAQCDFDGMRRDSPAPGAYILDGTKSAWRLSDKAAPPIHVCAH